jgi:hypothetical protein
MRRQRKLAKGLGNDTHVRDVYHNKFKTQSHSTYGILAGEIKFPQPEPLFKQNFVTVEFTRGGGVGTVYYPGAFIDPVSGNLHGVYEGPIPGQMVMVGFEGGNQQAPFVINRYPYQCVANTSTELDFFTPLTKKNYDATDVLIGHFSGSFISFNSGISSGKTPGSVTMEVMTDLEVLANTDISLESKLLMSFKSLETTIEATTSALLKSAEIDIESTASTTLKSAAINVEATTAINNVCDAGGEITIDSLIAIKNSAQSMGVLIPALITLLQGAVTIAAVPGSPLTLDPAFIALLELEKPKWAALLKT